MRPSSAELEAEFAAYHGVTYALATNSGTAALHAAFFGVGLGPGAEVITPSATWWSTVVPVLNVGAIPVFADVDPATGNIDPVDIEHKLTPRTKVVAVMHNGGIPCDMHAVLDIARRHDLRVVEDCSLAHGARYRERQVGTFGDAAAFSLATSKLVPAAEGGMLITDDPAVWRRATALGHHERLHRATADGTDGRPAEDEYTRLGHAGFGFKYRIHPLAAALARVGLSKLDEQNRRHQANVQYLLDHLADIPGLIPIRLPPYVQRVYNFVLPRLRYDIAAFGGVSIARFVAALRSEGAQVRGGGELVDWASLHTEPLFVERMHWAFHHPANAESVARGADQLLEKNAS